MSHVNSAAAAAGRDHPRDDPTLARAAVTTSARHRVLGWNVRVESNDERVIESVRVVFGPRLPDAGHDASVDVVARILVHDVDEDADFTPRQPLIRRQGALFSVTASRVSAVAGDSAAGFAFGFVSEQVASLPALLRDGFVLATVFCLLAPRFLTVVHAAGLARDGRAVQLRGDSGSGKTTLTYAALRHGYALLSEDSLYVRAPQPTPVRVSAADIALVGLPWSMHLLPDARQLFPELSDLEPLERLSGEHKLCVNVAERFPGRAHEQAPLGPLVFVARGGSSNPRLAALGRADALERLARTAIFDETVMAHAHGLWEAFLELPAFLLETGADPHDSVLLLDDVFKSY
jgi:hypothetical protein